MGRCSPLASVYSIDVKLRWLNSVGHSAASSFPICGFLTFYFYLDYRFLFLKVLMIDDNNLKLQIKVIK